MRKGGIRPPGPRYPSRGGAATSGREPSLPMCPPSRCRPRGGWVFGIGVFCLGGEGVLGCTHRLCHSLTPPSSPHSLTHSLTPSKPRPPHHRRAGRGVARPLRPPAPQPPRRHRLQGTYMYYIIYNVCMYVCLSFFPSLFLSLSPLSSLTDARMPIYRVYTHPPQSLTHAHTQYPAGNPRGRPPLVRFSFRFS